MNPHLLRCCWGNGDKKFLSRGQLTASAILAKKINAVDQPLVLVAPALCPSHPKVRGAKEKLFFSGRAI